MAKPQFSSSVKWRACSLPGSGAGTLSTSPFALVVLLLRKGEV